MHASCLLVNDIRDEGAVALAECLKINNTIRVMNLGGMFHACARCGIALAAWCA